MLRRVARWSYHRRRLAVLIWIAALISAFTLMQNFGGDYSEDFSLPGAESQKAFDLLKEEFPEVAGETATIAFKAEQGVTDPQVQSAMEGLFAQVSRVDRVIGIESPYSEAGAGQISPDGTISFATVRFEERGSDPIPSAIPDEIKALSTAAQVDGLTIEPGGDVIAWSEFEEPDGAEMVGLLAAVIILLIAFGSLLAMLFPIVTALLGIGIGLSLVFLFANFLSVPDFTPQITAMIGIGVGIDYALFVVTRHRQQMQSGLDPEQAAVIAIGTAGKAVMFAGITVVISLLGMLLMGFAFVQGLAVGAAAAVAITMLASITLLPALLGFAGNNIDRFRVPRRRREKKEFERTAAFRWSRQIQKRPWPFALGGLAAIVLLTLPLFSIRLGFADAGISSEERSSRRAFDLLTEGFGPGFNGPLLLATPVGGEADVAQLGAVGEALAATDGIAAVTPPVVSPSGGAAVLTAFPTTSPQNEETTNLVDRLRAEVIPQAAGGNDIFVGGLTAAIVDFSEANSSRLPFLIAVVISLSFLLLVAVFRSILVPVKAAIMNLLSISAAYGAVVAIFQWGWGASLIGVEGTAPIEAWAPMMLFAILFGLSMDYEVFLLSRIREEYVKTRDNALAVANGLALTARVITAAAAIMICLFLAFVIGFDERAIKLFGMGLAIAIFVDVTVVRMVLVPSTMELLGDANWWLPRWLDRILPRINIEGEEEVVEEVAEEVALEDAEARARAILKETAAQESKAHKPV
jgi:putative drug exporter of the RND superfamily